MFQCKRANFNSQEVYKQSLFWVYIGSGQHCAAAFQEVVHHHVTIGVLTIALLINLFKEHLLVVIPLVNAVDRS